MKFFRNLTTSFLIAIATLVLCYSSYTIYALSDYEFDGPTAGFYNIKTTYHSTMNDFFNDKLELLVDMLEEPSFYSNPDFLAPDTKEQCTPENVSTYCVSMDALEIYIDYLKTLEIARNDLTVISKDAITISEVLLGSTRIDAEVVAEIDEAKRVMEATIAAYDEFRMAYPMHKKYEIIINNLVKYKLALKDVRRESMRLPEKFIDATTVNCE